VSTRRTPSLDKVTPAHGIGAHHLIIKILMLRSVILLIVWCTVHWAVVR